MKSIGAACAALILLACGQSPVNAEGGTVKATDGGIAIGGNVTNSTIGVSDETLNEIVEDLKKGNEAQAETIALLKEKLDLNQNQIREAFHFVGSPIWIKNRPRQRRDFVPNPKK